MGNFQEAPATHNADLEALEKQFAAAMRQEKAGQPGAFRSSGVNPGGRVEMIIKDGKETVTTTQKPLNGNTAYAVTPTRPGHVKIAGLGEFPIEAAIKGGVLPEGWTPDRGFDQPAEGKAGNLAGNTDAARSDAETEAEDPTITPAMKAAVAEAERILDKVDAAHGADLTDRYMAEIAETGEIPTDGLPEGVTGAMIETVYAGYAAQANASLAEVGASVAMLEAMADPDHLREARKATLAQDKDTLKEIGRAAQSRLAHLPEKNPEAFAAILEGMDPKERAALHQNPGNKRWSVRIPGRPEMSFAHAVKQGVVRF